MKKIINWGIVSTAKIGWEYLIPAIHRSKNSKVIALASRNISQARSLSKKMKIPKCYGSYRELYQDPEIDIIYNPLPNHLHIKTSLEACNYGKHILLEKPLALNSKDIDPLIKAAKKHKVIIKEAFMVRHHPQWQWIKKYIKSGKIGKITNISSVFSYNNKDPKNIRNIQKYGGGAIYDIGCYPTVISRYLLDKEPKKLVASNFKDRNFKTDVLSSVLMDFGGIYSSFTVATQSNKSQQVFILGTKKSIVIENPFNAEPKKSTNIAIYHGNSIYRKDNTIKIFPPIDQYEVQVTAFSDHLLKKTKVDYDLVDAKKNMKVLDAIFKSSKKGSWVRV
ncbi:Gfo/Idh/MocA family oxidoreductase [Alphaproteobacteria bacterium]|nr:Gfo/Idh/MocA family oxidoreductase [Alphaproteobacteria bacterium]